MPHQINNFFDNDDVVITAQMGALSVIEWKRDLSVTPFTAENAYFASKMNVRRRQLTADLNKAPITLQAGAMQFMLGNVEMTTGMTGVGDYLGKKIRGSVTGESAVKPEYKGAGLLVCEPTYKFILLEDVAQWNGDITLDDGLFLGCYSTLQHRAVMRSNLSSAAAGGHGLFNLALSGQGVVALESPCPREELIEIYLQNDQIKIDGPLALAWSSSLQFTVERSSKTLIGSAASGEGLVNVYRGTGKILMAPTQYGSGLLNSGPVVHS